MEARYGICASSRRRTAPCCPCILKPYTSTRSWRVATRSLRTSRCRPPPDRNSRVDRFRDRRPHDPVELVRATLHRGGLLEQIPRAVLQAVRLHASSRRLVSQLRGLGAIPEFVLGRPRPRRRRGHGPPPPPRPLHALVALLHGASNGAAGGKRCGGGVAQHEKSRPSFPPIREGGSRSGRLHPE